MSQSTEIEFAKKALELHQSSKFDEAEIAYREILAEYPENAEVSHNLGVLLLQNERAEEALPYLVKAQTINPKNGLHWLSLAQCHIRLKAYG